MITWRGKVKIGQELRGHALTWVRVRARFEVFDDGTPEVPLGGLNVNHVWPLEALRDLTLGQLANLLLNVGRVVEVPPDPPYPGGTVGPDPPPLRAIGAALLEDFNDTRVILEDALPREFGP